MMTGSLVRRLEPAQTLFAGYYREVNSSVLSNTSALLPPAGQPGCACAHTKERRTVIQIGTNIFPISFPLSLIFCIFRTGRLCLFVFEFAVLQFHSVFDLILFFSIFLHPCLQIFLAPFRLLVLLPSSAPFHCLFSLLYYLFIDYFFSILIPFQFFFLFFGTFFSLFLFPIS